MTKFPEKINNLTYDEFIRIVTTIKDYHKFSENLYELSEHSMDLWEAPQISNLECELTEVISKLMNDELDTLNYFIFEIGFGDDYHKCEYDTGDEVIETPLTNFREHRVDWIIRGLSGSKNYNGERIHCAFFDIEFKKKGTIHLWFTNEELLKKWNIFAGKKKNFLPNDYGTKTYNDMSEQEQEIVNQFEGEKSYQDTVLKANYYLNAVTPMALLTGN